MRTGLSFYGPGRHPGYCHARRRKSLNRLLLATENGDSGEVDKQWLCSSNHDFCDWVEWDTARFFKTPIRADSIIQLNGRWMAMAMVSIFTTQLSASVRFKS